MLHQMRDLGMIQKHSRVRNQVLFGIEVRVHFKSCNNVGTFVSSPEECGIVSG